MRTEPWPQTCRLHQLEAWEVRRSTKETEEEWPGRWRILRVRSEECGVWSEPGETVQDWVQALVSLTGTKSVTGWGPKPAGLGGC